MAGGPGTIASLFTSVTLLPGLVFVRIPAAAADRDPLVAHRGATPETTRVGASVLRDDQCQPQWLPTFGAEPGVNGEINSLAVFDDGSGSGPALYAGGYFSSAGGVSANSIAKWDGSSWSAVGSGTNWMIYALAVFDDGSGGGPALYAGGFFTTAGGVSANHVAKWNGSSWSPLGSGTNEQVDTLAVFDDGSGNGPAVYAGGHFTAAGGASANHIAKWDGSSWSAVGGGMNDDVEALTVFDDGSGGGAALYAGGSFTAAGGASANRVAKWDGSSWSALGSGISGAPGPYVSVRALTVFDDGSGTGPALYAGGWFKGAGEVSAGHIAKWDGSSWSALGSGMDGSLLHDESVHALTAFDDGSGGGPALYAGGTFSTAGGASANHIAKWDGSSWSALDGGMDDVGTLAVSALAVFDDGSGTAIYAGGGFTAAGSVDVNSIARWNGSSWSALGSGLNSSVGFLAVFDDGAGSGPNLYAAGSDNIAKWDGSSWSALGSGIDEPIWLYRALSIFDDGSGNGPALYAGGIGTVYGTSVVAKWDGSSWSVLGSGMTFLPFALTGFDDGSGGGPALYAGGANRVAEWDGSSWLTLGSGMDYSVRALAVFDDGTGGGPALYAGGDFFIAGGVSAHRIAKWDGSSWSALDSGMNNVVRVLRVFDDGAGGGPALYAGGDFTTAGGVKANHIAKWDGSSWSALGSGMDSKVVALTVFDDGTADGPALYAGGAFSTAGGVSANGIAKWDGSSWSALSSGMDGGVLTLTAFDGGTGSRPSLYAGGGFTVSAAGDSQIARWQGCPSCPWDLDGDSEVGIIDFLTLLAQWGTYPGGPPDFDANGVVGPADFEALQNAWGPCG